MALINELLRRQANFSTVTIKEAEAKKHSPDFDILASLNILERGSASSQRDCPTCHGEILDVVVVSGTKAYTLCSQDEMSGRDYFNPEELKQWIFNTPALLSLFQKAISSDPGQLVEIVPGLIWDLGKIEINNNSYRLFFVCTPNLANEKMSALVNQFSQIIFITADIFSHIGSNRTVPLSELIQDITNEGLVLNRHAVEHYFPSIVGIPNSSAIEISENITLQNNQLMFGKLPGGVFKKVCKIRPLCSRIIERLFQIRQLNDCTMTLQALAEALGSKKKSIGNHIKQINDTCLDNQSLPILSKYGRNKWCINPLFKTTSSSIASATE